MTTTDESTRIDVDLPPEFHAVPLDPAVEDRAVAQRELIETLAIDDAERREGLGWFLEALALMTRDTHVSGTAFCAVELDGRPSTATLTVATQAMPSDGPLVFAQGAYESMRAKGGYTSVRLDRIGTVSGVVATREVEVDGRSTQQITVVVPVPGQRLGVFVTVATDDLDHAAVYEQVAVDAARSVRVTAVH
ncbi:hypothetical protein [Solicola gregarius]|uniref:Uncharacterized protein n=1 Tax=Solicola gregarius TaxID=2908642 RepID=A0AA46TIG3_9ACTN|nr:hypothetical protein [Solicola gregarius]UYM05896.1 hypothetical protein L0C25_02140 [Solicola gregarius]